MFAETNSETKAAIWAHHQNGLSCRKIASALITDGVAVSKTGVNRVIRKIQLEREGAVKPLKRLGSQNERSVRTPALIKKVKYLINRPDPWSHRAISRKLNVSCRTIRRVIKEDLQGVVRKKRKTHHLSHKQVAQRLEKGPRLLTWLKRDKWKNIVSIDEAWCYLSHCNGRRKIHYAFRGMQAPESWRKICVQKHPRGIMFVAGISAHGTTAIRFVPYSAKVTSVFYINKVLKPLFSKDIPRLFGKNEKISSSTP